SSLFSGEAVGGFWRSYFCHQTFCVSELSRSLSDAALGQPDGKNQQTEQVCKKECRFHQDVYRRSKNRGTRQCRQVADLQRFNPVCRTEERNGHHQRGRTL